LPTGLGCELRPTVFHQSLTSAKAADVTSQSSSSCPLADNQKLESLLMGLLMASTSVIRLAARPPISSCLRPAFRSIRRAPLPAPAVQSGCAKSAFSTTSVWKNQPGHEEETFEEFSARYMSFHQLDIPRPLPLG
jgi:hypothetical protein